MELGWYEPTFEFLDLCSRRKRHQLKNRCHRWFSSAEPTLLVGQLLRPTVQFYSRFFCYYIQVTRICYGKWVTYQRPTFCGTLCMSFFFFVVVANGADLWPLNPAIWGQAGNLLLLESNYRPTAYRTIVRKPGFISFSSPSSSSSLLWAMTGHMLNRFYRAGHERKNNLWCIMSRSAVRKHGRRGMWRENAVIPCGWSWLASERGSCEETEQTHWKIQVLLRKSLWDGGAQQQHLFP